MGYRYEKRPDGILVRGVRVVKPIARTQRKELAKVGRDLDESFMREAVSRFNAELASGKLYPLTLNHRGKRVGRKLAQAIVQHDGKPTITEDFLITDPETQARWLRGELPEISGDLDLENPEVYATSLLETGEGHFGHGDIGQFYPDDLALKLKGEGHKPEHCICLLAEKETNMDEKTLLELLKKNNAELLGEIDKKIDAKIAPVLELSKKTANTDPLDPANDIHKERERSDVLLKDAEEKRKLELAKEKDIGQKLAEAAQVDIGISLPAYRAQLEKRDQQARDDYHRLCLERARHGRQSVQTNDDPANKNKSRVELELSADYRREKDQWEKIGINEDRYIEMISQKRAEKEAQKTYAGAA